MRLNTTAALAVAALAAASPALAQTTLDFEGDVGGVAGYVTEHNGFTFSGGFGDFSWVHSTSFGDVTPNSGDYLAWANGGTFLTLTGGGSFNFYSAFLVGRNGSCTGASTAQTVRGFLGGVEQYSSTQDLNCTGGLTQYTFGFTNIDMVQFDIGDAGGVNLVLDDLEVGEAGVVPEPATVFLMLTGLLAVGAAGYRRRRADVT